MQSPIFLFVLLVSFTAAVQPPPQGGLHPPSLQGGLHPLSPPAGLAHPIAGLPNKLLPPPPAGASLSNANHTCPFNATLSGIYSAVNNLALTPPFNITPSHNCSGNATALIGQILGGFATLFQNATFAHFLPSHLPSLPPGGLPAWLPGFFH